MSCSLQKWCFCMKRNRLTGRFWQDTLIKQTDAEAEIPPCSMASSVLSRCCWQQNWSLKICILQNQLTVSIFQHGATLGQMHRAQDISCQCHLSSAILLETNLTTEGVYRLGAMEMAMVSIKNWWLTLNQGESLTGAAWLRLESTAGDPSECGDGHRPVSTTMYLYIKRYI